MNCAIIILVGKDNIKLLLTWTIFILGLNATRISQVVKNNIFTTFWHLSNIDRQKDLEEVADCNLLESKITREDQNP